MGEGWKLLAHLRERPSYCTAAFRTFQNTTLERGFCSYGRIAFQVGVRSFQQVSFPALPRPQGHTRKVGEAQRGPPLPDPEPASTLARISDAPGPGDGRGLRPVAARPALPAPGGLRGRDGGAGAAERAVVWPLFAD